MPCNLKPSSRCRKTRGRIALLFALISLALTVLPTTSFAGTDTAGNVLATEVDSNPSGVEGDLYWAGQSLNLDDASIGRDIIAAGESLSIRDCTVGGAVRLAARTIDISKTAIDGSVTVAGQHVVLNTGSAANCFYAMGETVALQRLCQVGSTRGQYGNHRRHRRRRCRGLGRQTHPGQKRSHHRHGERPCFRGPRARRRSRGRRAQDRPYRKRKRRHDG